MSYKFKYLENLDEPREEKMKRLKVIGNTFYQPVFEHNRPVILIWELIFTDEKTNCFRRKEQGMRKIITNFKWTRFFYAQDVGDLFLERSDAVHTLVNYQSNRLNNFMMSEKLKGITK